MDSKFLEILKNPNEFNLFSKKKNELLEIWKKCKNKEIEEIWLSVYNILVDCANSERVVYNDEKSSLLFKDDDGRNTMIACVNFLSTYLQHLVINEKKRKIALNFQENFKMFFNRMAEIQLMLSEKNIRLGFGKCLLTMCEMKLAMNEFSDSIKIHTLLFLLWKSCSSEGKISDIAKLKQYKDFCRIIDWDIVNRTTTYIYILCAYTLNVPKFYETADGKYFLSYVWCQHRNIAIHIFNKFVRNIPELCYENILHYSKIIHSVWKNCTSDLREVVEKQLERLVHFSFRCSLKVASRFRLSLSCFHVNKGDKTINELLFKIYDSVIWRSFMSPNWKIRFNAVCIFQLIFPVVDPGTKEKNYQEEIEKAYKILKEIAEDYHPCVRQAAAKCIGHILNELWEIINEKKRGELLDILIDRLLKDKCSDGVREETLLGLCELAKNKNINRVFIKLFYRIKHMINDKSLAVRNVFASLVLELNQNVNHNFTKDLDLNELMKRVTKDYFASSVHTFIKKLSYYKWEQHEKIKHSNQYNFLKKCSLILTHTIWKCDIKEQSKMCVNFVNECPALMICISKFCTNLPINERYKLAAVLFEIVNFKLREEENYFLLSTNENATLEDSKSKKKYVRYSSLLVVIANFLKPRNDDENEICSSEEIQEFLKQNFEEKYFLESINTLMQPFYFKVLRYINLNHDNYLAVHKYGQVLLNSVGSKDNEQNCEQCIIPLFHKWGLLSELIEKHVHFLNSCFDSIFTQVEMIRNSMVFVNESHGSDEHLHLLMCHEPKLKDGNKESGITKEEGNTIQGKEDKGNKRKRKEEKQNEIAIKRNKINVTGTNNTAVNERTEKSKDVSYIYINKEEEFNALYILFFIIKKKKYHDMLFIHYHNVLYNFMQKFNHFYLYTFEIMSDNTFCLPPHFISSVHERQNVHIQYLIIIDENKVKKYMQLYNSLFLLFSYFCLENELEYDWDILKKNIIKSIASISSIKFKNEIDIITNKIREPVKDTQEVTEEKMKWQEYLSLISTLLLYFLDLIEYLVALRQLPIDEIYFDDYIKNVFLFFKCYEIVNGKEQHEQSTKAYLKIWERICSFLFALLNFQYFAKKLHLKCMVFKNFLLFTFTVIPQEDIVQFLDKCFFLIKEKEELGMFFQDFKNYTDITNFMEPQQIDHIQGAIDKALSK